MKNKAGDPVAIDEAKVPLQVRKDAGMYGPDGDDFGPRYILAGGKAYRRRQGIWQGKRDYKPSAPGQWYVEDAPEDGLAKGAPGLEEPAPVKPAPEPKAAKPKDEPEVGKPTEPEKPKAKEEPAKPEPKTFGNNEMTSQSDAKDQMKAQAAGNKLETSHFGSKK